MVCHSPTMKYSPGGTDGTVNDTEPAVGSISVTRMSEEMGPPYCDVVNSWNCGISPGYWGRFEVLLHTAMTLDGALCRVINGRNNTPGDGGDLADRPDGALIGRDDVRHVGRCLDLEMRAALSVGTDFKASPC